MSEDPVSGVQNVRVANSGLELASGLHVAVNAGGIERVLVWHANALEA
jgi:hypothetical protein